MVEMSGVGLLKGLGAGGRSWLIVWSRAADAAYGQAIGLEPDEAVRAYLVGARALLRRRPPTPG